MKIANLIIRVGVQHDIENNILKNNNKNKMDPESYYEEIQKMIGPQLSEEEKQKYKEIGEYVYSDMDYYTQEYPSEEEV